MKLIFATHNHNKAKEIQSLVPAGIEILTLDDIECKTEIPETSSTLEGNANQKMQYIIDNYNVNCFADDTGLEIVALNGEPGVFSARYAGAMKDPNLNMDLVLNKLNGVEDRSARFRTVIALFWNGKKYQFEGIVTGKITLSKSGKDGFGYDPIFEPENCGKTFADMNLIEKNLVSHRARAFEKMIEFLNQHSI
jgi:XTP/dITP diphosphohydrolase